MPLQHNQRGIKQPLLLTLVISSPLHFLAFVGIDYYTCDTDTEAVGIGRLIVGENGFAVRAVGGGGFVPPGCEGRFAFAADGGGGADGGEGVPAFDAIHGEGCVEVAVVGGEGAALLFVFWCVGDFLFGCDVRRRGES